MKVQKKHHNYIFVVSILSTLIVACNKPSSNNDREQKLQEILLNISPPQIPSYTINIKNLGATGDSTTNCKPAFEKAFASATQHGGAHIIVPRGVYFIKGPLHLVSNICLDLQKGARLSFSEQPTDYLPEVLTSWEGTFLYNYSPFIYGYQLQNISIIGEGAIDGNAKAISAWDCIDAKDQELSRQMNHESTPIKQRIFGKGHFLRPQFIQLFECKNILIDGITIINSPFWDIHLLKSENITVRNISYKTKNINNDGVDIELSKNVLIEKMNFKQGDDNISIKAGRDNDGRNTKNPTENIVIRNCKFNGLHGVVLGSEVSGGIRNVYVEDCNANGFLKRGIFIKTNPDRGGFIENIYVRNVTFEETDDCFFITSVFNGEGQGNITDIHNIYLDNIFCKKSRHTGISVQGFPGKPIRDIYFSNIVIRQSNVAINLDNTYNVVMNNVKIGGASTPTSSMEK